MNNFKSTITLIIFPHALVASHLVRGVFLDSARECFELKKVNSARACAMRLINQLTSQVGARGFWVG